MDVINEPNENYFSKDVTEEGKTVTVYARAIDDLGWELSIRGKGNQLSTWTDLFATQEEAITEGLSSILREGVDEYYSSEDFAYLDGL